MTMSVLMGNIVDFLGHSKYILLFLAAFFEGPVIMISAGFLWHLGLFSFIPMYLAMVGGDFVGDVVWYLVGYWGAKPMIKRFSKFFNITPEILQKAEHKFSIYHEKILIISKLTMGFGLAIGVLMFAGMAKVPFKRYAVINLVGGFIWVSFLIMIGFFFGNIYTLIPAYLKIGFVVVLFIVVILGIQRLKKYLSEIEL